MASGRRRNDRLAAVIAEAGWSHAQVASAFLRVAAEANAREFAAVGRSHVSHWVAGSSPSGSAAGFLAEALSRRLGRVVTLDEIGLASPSRSSTGSPSRSSAGSLSGSPAVATAPDWSLDSLTALADLGRGDVDIERRSVLGAAAYSVAALALPSGSWWEEMARRGGERSELSSRVIGQGDLEAVRETALLFSRIDQRRGGGHARMAVVQYLTSDIAGYLRASYTDDRTRRAMFSTAGELAYLAGWMAFDNAEHSIAQRYFTVAVKLAAEADDPPLAGHILRAMAHQALDLGHRKKALDLATAAVDGRRFALASARERALVGVIHARALGANQHNRDAAAALIRAEDNLASANVGDEEPSRVFFFSEASLAHETARTLREMGDLTGAVREFHRSVRTRRAETFTRTHVVTLGYLGSTLARLGGIEEACGVWSDALNAMDGIRSGRARQVAVDLRSELSPFKARGLRSVVDLDARALAYLRSGSPP